MELVIPGINGLPIDKATVARTGVQMQMPFRIGETDRSMWLLPLEPLVSVRGRNVITRRTIAKMRASGGKEGYGSVKELWTKDDYEIIVTGVLDDHEKRGELPSDPISRLNGLFSLRKPLIIECALLNILGISQIVIESWEFPATPNIEDQAYTFRGFSDQNFNLLIEK